MSDFPRALPAPPGDLVPLTAALVEGALAGSRRSPRGRLIQRLHKSDAEPLHRMLNAVQPGSYVRPHRHLAPPKPEAWLVLRGAALFFTFEDDGRVRDVLEVAAGTDLFGVDLAAGVFHTLVAVAPDTVVYEAKPGPYAPADDKELAPWAPAEGDPGAAAYLRSLLDEHRRRAGARPPP